MAYADAQVARLVDAVPRARRDGRTVVVVTGDHGEGLGDHGEHTHGMLAYDSTLKVPLILSGATMPKRVVSCAGVARRSSRRRCLRLAGLQPAGAGADLLAPEATERDVYAETQYPRSAGWHALSVLAGERWKLIQSSETELYDLSSDPSEQKNVAQAHAGVVQGMTTRLAAFQAAAPSRTGSDFCGGVGAAAGAWLRQRIVGAGRR